MLSNKILTQQIDCYDWDSDGSHDLIGSFTATVEEFLKCAHGEVSFPVINESKKAKKKSYTKSGTVFVSKCEVKNS